MSPPDDETVAAIGADRMQANIHDRVTRLEVWRTADRERSMAFEAEMRGASNATLSKIDSVAADVKALNLSLAGQAGLRQVVSWASGVIVLVLSGVAGFFMRHLFGG